MIYNEDKDRLELMATSEQDRQILMLLKQKLNKKIGLFFTMDAGATSDQSGLVIVLEEDE